MKIKTLGSRGPVTSTIGYGAMVLEGYYGATDDSAAVRTLIHAIEAGAMIDSADAYGNGHNESLIAEAVKGRRDKAFIATKFGIVFQDGEHGTDLQTGWGFALKINGTPEYAAKALDASLVRLNVETIDLWFAHYPDPSVPIEETVGAMAEAVKEGKVRYLGLSNVNAEEVRRANRIHPVTAVQYEYSLWRREAETELLPTLRELGIALVGWSPLGAGFLAGSVDNVSDNDFRRNNPRFTGNNFETNKNRFAPLFDIARELGCTPAQLALAWLLHRGDDIFPIPGTRTPSRIDENLKAADLKLSEEVLKKISEIAMPGIASGATLL